MINTLTVTIKETQNVGRSTEEYVLLVCTDVILEYILVGHLQHNLHSEMLYLDNAKNFRLTSSIS